MNTPSQLDNISVMGMANGAIGLFANVFAGLQNKYGTNATGWINSINDLDDIVYADHLRVTGLQYTDTSRYQSDAITNNRTYFSDRSSVDFIATTANVDITSGVITPHYYTILPTKIFSNASTQTSTTLNDFINTTINNDQTYANLNITSSKDYAINNGYVSDYTQLTNSSFDTTGVVSDIQLLAEYRLALLKTTIVNNNILD
jgi:hypothetical protein